MDRPKGRRQCSFKKESLMALSLVSFTALSGFQSHGWPDFTSYHYEKIHPNPTLRFLLLLVIFRLCNKSSDLDRCNADATKISDWLIWVTKFLKEIIDISKAQTSSKVKVKNPLKDQAKHFRAIFHVLKKTKKKKENEIVALCVFLRELIFRNHYRLLLQSVGISFDGYRISCVQAV
ncbi:hypothetical protein WN51_06522 [Melipona quadrifasciata]|uniref:Uncharacterized protein n=1 Tax=Melipona quadrifasciata TaxID=166423 RepID=A0A0M8ZT17_9HYME|nr:hypothetical protein WN51_06522 [Melipona quadrifasciata]